MLAKSINASFENIFYRYLNHNIDVKEYLKKKNSSTLKNYFFIYLKSESDFLPIWEIICDFFKKESF